MELFSRNPQFSTENQKRQCNKMSLVLCGIGSGSGEGTKEGKVNFRRSLEWCLPGVFLIGAE